MWLGVAFDSLTSSGLTSNDQGYNRLFKRLFAAVLGAELETCDRNLKDFRASDTQLSGL